MMVRYSSFYDHHRRNLQTFYQKPNPAIMIVKQSSFHDHDHENMQAYCLTLLFGLIAHLISTKTMKLAFYNHDSEFNHEGHNATWSVAINTLFVIFLSSFPLRFHTLSPPTSSPNNF